MPILHFTIDLFERPIIDLAIMVSSDDQIAGPEQIYSLRGVKALVDTGAGRSQIDVAILDTLGISQAGEVNIYTASTGDQPEPMPLFLIDLLFTGDRPSLLAPNLEVVGSNKLSGLKVDMLLGRDVLDRCLLIYDGGNRRFTLAYNPPSAALI